MESKTSLRKQYSALRHSLTAAYKEQAVQHMATKLPSLPFFRPGLHVACYLPIHDELNTAFLIEALWQLKCYCYLPVLQADNEKTLLFIRYEQGTSLHRNKLGILEPSDHHLPFTPTQL